MNHLHEKFESKGLTIIGVTDEPAGKIEKFIDDRGIDYLVAIGGGEAYRTRGIPHAWLVGAKGEVVWEGHPMQLKEGMIEKFLKEVQFK
ncbi:MAG: hypothetical protein HY717_06880 [Planctomycetes bacterium]|nr:hypothetical protein [Planctomycetota bacterium]